MSMIQIKRAILSLCSTQTHHNQGLRVGSWLLCITHGTLAQVKFISRKMQLCAKALSVQIGEWSERSRGKRPRRGGALVFQGTPLCQSIPGWQVGRENLPCCSAGSNMCLHYQLHCNQYLTGGLTGLLAHCHWQKEKRGKTNVDGELLDVGWNQFCEHRAF